MIKEVRYLYWSFDLEIISYSLVGATIRVWRGENDPDFYIYRISDEEICAMELINGERAWNQIVDEWMAGRSDTREEGEEVLKEILSAVKKRCNVELFSKTVKTESRLSVVRHTNNAPRRRTIIF